MFPRKCVANTTMCPTVCARPCVSTVFYDQRRGCVHCTLHSAARPTFCESNGAYFCSQGQCAHISARIALVIQLTFAHTLTRLRPTARANTFRYNGAICLQSQAPSPLTTLWTSRRQPESARFTRSPHRLSTAPRTPEQRTRDLVKWRVAFLSVVRASMW